MKLAEFAKTFRERSPSESVFDHKDALKRAWKKAQLEAARRLIAEGNGGPVRATAQLFEIAGLIVDLLEDG